MFATKNGHIEIVKYLVDKGADVTRAKEVSHVLNYAIVVALAITSTCLLAHVYCMK